MKIIVLFFDVVIPKGIHLRFTQKSKMEGPRYTDLLLTSLVFSISVASNFLENYVTE